MEVQLTKILAALILPPGVNVLLFAAALALWRRARALSMGLLIVSLVSLYAFSIPTGSSPKL